MNKLIINKSVFENIKHIDENDNEYWEARKLAKLLEYKEWRKIKGVIDKAIIACNQSNIIAFNHFVEADKMIEIAKGGKRKILDYKLSRYACHLITQNGDSRKKSNSFSSDIFCNPNKESSLGQMTNKRDWR